LNYYEALETYSRIGLLRSSENLRSYSDWFPAESSENITIYRDSTAAKWINFPKDISIKEKEFNSLVEKKTSLGEVTLETSVEDDKLHSKRVEKMINYPRNELRR
jgi:hypothetical protein